MEKQRHQLQAWQIPSLSAVPVVIRQARKAILDAGGGMHDDGSIEHPSVPVRLEGIILPYPQLGSVVIVRQPLESTRDGRGEPFQMTMGNEDFSPVKIDIFTPDGNYGSFVQWQPNRFWFPHPCGPSGVAMLLPGHEAILDATNPLDYFRRSEKPKSRKNWLVIGHLEEQRNAAEKQFKRVWSQLFAEIDAMTLVGKENPVPPEWATGEFTPTHHPKQLRRREWKENPFHPETQFWLWRAFFTDCMAGQANSFRYTKWAIRRREVDRQRYFCPGWRWAVVNGWVKFGLSQMGWPRIREWVVDTISPDATVPVDFNESFKDDFHVAASRGRAVEEDENSVNYSLPPEDQADPCKFLPYVKRSGKLGLLEKVGCSYLKLGYLREAERWYHRAAVLGNIEAMYTLACFARSEGERRAWMRKAAAAGHPCGKDYFPSRKRR